jgi:iron complex transport system permease protein
VDVDNLLLMRLIASFCAGVLLSCSGSLTQAVTQNPLAGPSSLGATVVVVAIILGLHLLLTFAGGDPASSWFIAGNLELWALPTTVLALLPLHYWYERKFRRRPKLSVYGNRPAITTEQFVLGGLLLNLMMGAFLGVTHFALMSLNHPFPDQLWYGNFKFVHPTLFWFQLVLTVGVWGVMFKLARQLRPFCFGHEVAAGLGLSIEKLMGRGIFLAYYMVAIVFSLYGVFAFAGLVFPHILRSFSLFNRSLKAELVLGSLLSGAGLCLLDYLCWSFPLKGAEIPVGMLSTLVGTLVLVVVYLKAQLTKE